jgi:hypothetical protein
MVKKHVSNKRANITRKEYTLWAIIVLLLISQVVSAIFLARLINVDSRDSKQSLYAFINRIEEKRYKYPVIDVSEGRVYIPEARIYLPLTDTTRNLRYEYQNTVANTLHLSVSSAVGSQREEDDPTCDKIITITPASSRLSTNESLVGTIQPTKDGLSHITAIKKACKTYQASTWDELAQAAKAIQQY